METKQIKDLSEVELKAMITDLSDEIILCQRNVQIIRQEIMNRINAVSPVSPEEKQEEKQSE